MKKTLKVVAAILVAGLLLFGVVKTNQVSAKNMIDPPFGLSVR